MVGNLFFGGDGWIVVDDDGFQVYKGEKSEKVMDEKRSRAADTTVPHMENFLRRSAARNYKD